MDTSEGNVFHDGHGWRYTVRSGDVVIQAEPEVLEKEIPSPSAQVQRQLVRDARFGRALHTHFSSMSRSQPTAFTTPFFKSIARTERTSTLLAFRDAMAGKLKRLACSSSYPTVMREWDVAQWNKGGPKSVRVAEFYWKELENFAAPHTRPPSTAVRKKAIAAVRARIEREHPGFRPVSWRLVDTPSGTNVGLTNGILMRNNYQRSLQPQIHAAALALKRMGQNARVNPAVTGCRVQAKSWSPIQKNRLVWMVPASYNTIMLGWIKPIIAEIQRTGATAAFFASVIGQEQVVRVLNKFQIRKTLSLDYSQFDSTIPHWLLGDAIEVLSALVVENERDEFTFWASKGLTIGLMVGPTTRFRNRDGGMLSGLGHTNLTDGVSAALAMEMGISELGGVLGLGTVNGDDNAWEIDGVKPEGLSNTIMAMTGLKVNLEKSAWQDRVELNQLVRFAAGPSACYPLGRALSSACFKEYKSEAFTAFDYTMRLANILNNLASHPHREFGLEMAQRHDRTWATYQHLYAPEKFRFIENWKPTQKWW